MTLPCSWLPSLAGVQGASVTLQPCAARKRLPCSWSGMYVADMPASAPAVCRCRVSSVRPFAAAGEIDLCIATLSRQYPDMLCVSNDQDHILCNLQVCA